MAIDKHHIPGAALVPPQDADKALRALMPAIEALTNHGCARSDGAAGLAATYLRDAVARFEAIPAGSPAVRAYMNWLSQNTVMVAVLTGQEIGELPSEPEAGSPEDLERELQALSAKASPGPLRGGHRCDGAIRATVDGERVSLGEDIPSADAAFWAKLANAYRDGRLRVSDAP